MLDSPRTPADLLAATLRRAPAAPLLTSYDDLGGGRVELSAATLANWVAKTANLLQDEFDVTGGSTVAVALPVHWQTAAVLLGVWSCGATVLDTAAEDDGRLDEADVVLAAQDRLPSLEEQGLPELLGLSLHPLGMGMTGYAGPARDFALEVRGHGDVFTPWQRPDPAAPGLLLGGLELTLGGLVDTARELAGRLGLVGGDRVLIDDRTAAEALRNVLLVTEVDPLERPEDPEEFYDHQLVGLGVRTPAGAQVGTIAEVLHLPGQDVLAVRRGGSTVDGSDVDGSHANDAEVLVPFVADIVPTVDLESGFVVITPPPGLLDPEAAELASKDDASNGNASPAGGSPSTA